MSFKMTPDLAPERVWKQSHERWIMIRLAHPHGNRQSTGRQSTGLPINGTLLYSVSGHPVTCVQWHGQPIALSRSFMRGICKQSQGSRGHKYDNPLRLVSRRVNVFSPSRPPSSEPQRRLLMIAVRAESIARWNIKVQGTILFELGSQVCNSVLKCGGCHLDKRGTVP